MARSLRVARTERLQGIHKRRVPKICIPFTTIDSIQKGRDIDELRARLHKIEIQRLIPCHAGKIMREGHIAQNQLRWRKVQQSAPAEE
jgi:hypothetical protein